MKHVALDTFLEHEAFNALDRHFARRIGRRSKPESRLSGHAAAIASEASAARITVPLLVDFDIGLGRSGVATV